MKKKKTPRESEMQYFKSDQIDTTLKQDRQKAWEIISPFWPLQNIITVNPLQGLENLPFEEALIEGAAYFEQEDLPRPMEAINRLTIKWLQVFLDQGQATINMPLRNKGLYNSWLRLALFDNQLHGKDSKKQQWLRILPESSEKAITECLLYLSIKKENRQQFMKLMLTTLVGWSSYIKYLTKWCEIDHEKPVTQSDYLAIRLVITCLIWPEANKILAWHQSAIIKASQKIDNLEKITKSELNYRLPLLKQLASQSSSIILKTNENTNLFLNAQHQEYINIKKAQLIFCIDVRSEPFRRSLESIGDYETFGIAGFFGVAAQIENNITNENYASCPVLLKPKHRVKEFPNCSNDAYLKDKAGYATLNIIKSIYQSLKYNFVTSFALVEIIGIWSAIWMIIRSFFPSFGSVIKNFIINIIRPTHELIPDLENVSFADQCYYAEKSLRIIGLIKNFAPIVVLCGHGSTTSNNAFASALHCGACGARQGASNARILVRILNDIKVRKILEEKDIFIPCNTRFIAAQHNTTTDQVVLYNIDNLSELTRLKQDLETARLQNSKWRCKNMGIKNQNSSTANVILRSNDWAQVRAELGLAGNSSLIIAPRLLTKNINLEGRSFLHSYDYKQDISGDLLNAILTAPMVVTQWINAQYLFSALNNVSYGAGSKITKNITGKFAIMQGNASDLMTGLPLQSLFKSDRNHYHDPQRLMIVVFAPRSMIDIIVKKEKILQKLFGNGWVALACIDPENNHTYLLESNLLWNKIF